LTEKDCFERQNASHTHIVIARPSRSEQPGDVLLLFFC